MRKPGTLTSIKKCLEVFEEFAFVVEDRGMAFKSKMDYLS